MYHNITAKSSVRLRMAVARGAQIGLLGSRGLFTGVAIVSGLVCSNDLIGRPI